MKAAMKPACCSNRGLSRLIAGVAAASIGFAALAAAGAAAAAEGPERRVYYIGPVSDHFDGRQFFNPEGEQGTGGASKESAGQLIKRVVDGPKGTWPKSVPVTPTKPAARVDGQEMLVTWIGHSTVLVQTQGLNILTDPVWAERASPSQFIGPKRVRQPGVRLRDLPKIDLILISHNHYDHLDMATLERLWRRDRPLIVTGLGNDKLLAERGVSATAKDWGETVAVRPGIEVVLDRVHHWSARWDDDHDHALWTGFTVRMPGGNIFFAGDTGPGEMAWASAAAAHGPVRLALLPIGAFKPNLPASGNHIDPAEAVTAFEQLGAAYALGVHWGTFELTPEQINDPPEYLAKALAEHGIPADRFRVTVAGEAWTIPALADPKP
jgi:L-ascorbate metabolism protein UlaG (beta-lactamase superfamily)